MSTAAAGTGLAVRLRCVSVVYNPGTVLARSGLEDVDLELPLGAVTAVVGATASGKSTLLQLVAGLLPATEGDVQILGGARPSAGTVGMVLQRAEMQLFSATVWDDVAVAPRLRGVEGKALAARVEEALLTVGLDPAAFGGRSPHALSLGEQRRVALAGILSLRPRLLVLDEPGAGLDPVTRRRLLAGLLRWQEDSAGTLVFTSHDLEEVATAAHRVVVLTHGRVVASGTAESVLGDAELLQRAGLTPPLAARVGAKLGATAGGSPVDAAGLASFVQTLLRPLVGRR
jgi:energy-coupling factor transport system ATP-binding protein